MPRYRIRVGGIRAIEVVLVDADEDTERTQVRLVPHEGYNLVWYPDEKIVRGLLKEAKPPRTGREIVGILADALSPARRQFLLALAGLPWQEDNP